MAEFDRVLFYFEKLSEVPRVSGHMEKVSAFLRETANDLGLECKTDKANNIIIFKPGTTGSENLLPVILQGHMDMVGDTAPGVSHDFENDGIKLIYDGDELRADGTTLGGDDGIAVAMILAILEDSTMPHPPIEAVITTDEEIGLLGAAALDCSDLKGRLMINLDSEDEGILTAGCAGGMTATTELPVIYEKKDGTVINIMISGLYGGHSGVMINKGRGNAIKLMGRLLDELRQQIDMSIVSMRAGEKDNVIPFEAKAAILIDSKDIQKVKDQAKAFENCVNREFEGSDNLILTVEEGKIGTCDTLNSESTAKVIAQLMSIPYGVIKMTKSLPDLVQTSSNIGVIRLENGLFRTISSVRSSVVSERDLIGRQILSLTEALGGKAFLTGVYPAWEYRPESPLRDLMCRVWKEQTGKDLTIDVIHAGLECGIFYEKLPGLDAVSIGPDLKDIHTYRESLNISSAKRLCVFVDDVLKSLA